MVLATGAAVARQLLAEIGVAVPEAPSSPTQVVLLASDHPGDTPALRAVAVEDATRLTKLDLTEHVIGFVAVTHQMPGKLTPQVRDDILAATAAAGVDVVGAWLDGNGIGRVIEGVERVR